MERVRRPSERPPGEEAIRKSIDLSETHEEHTNQKNAQTAAVFILAMFCLPMSQVQAEQFVNFTYAVIDGAITIDLTCSRR